MSRSPEPVSCLPLLPAPIISVNDFPRIGGGQHTSSVKSQIVNIFSFVNHVLSALTTQFCNCREPAAVENTETKEHGCVQIKLYLQKQMTGCIRPTSCSLPTSVREQPPCGLAQGPWWAFYGFTPSGLRTQTPLFSLLPPSSPVALTLRFLLMLKAEECGRKVSVTVAEWIGLSLIKPLIDAGVQRPTADNSLGNAGKFRLLCLSLRPKSRA